MRTQTVLLGALDGSNVAVGLIGVAVGAVLAGGIQALIAWRARIVLARGAARILIDDLITAKAILSDSLSSDLWWPNEYAIPLKGWHEYRSLLATGVSNDDWTFVGSAFHKYAIIEMARAATIDRASEKEYFERHRQRIEEALERTQHALVVLTYRSLNLWECVLWKNKKLLRDQKQWVRDERAKRERELREGSGDPASQASLASEPPVSP